MPSDKAPFPSAPVDDEFSSTGAYRQPAEAPQPPQPEVVNTIHVGAPVQTPLSEAPPPYEAALRSPVNPPYPLGEAKGQPSAYSAPPYQPQQINPNPIPESSATVVEIRYRGDCPHCQTGDVRKETDVCCLTCLLIIALFTLPLGLFFLCCIPCTWKKRCSHCRKTV